MRRPRRWLPRRPGAWPAPRPAKEASRGELSGALAAARAEIEAQRNLAESAEAQAAAIDAELQAVRWEKDEIEARLKAAQASGAAPSAGEVARLREELAARAAEVAELRGETEGRAAELTALANQLSDLQAREAPSGSPEARVKDAETKLAEALRRLADAEALAQAALSRPDAPGGETADRLRQLVEERGILQRQVGERDTRISRLQREVADKTDRLGRLTKEMGELKSKGLGKLFR